MKLAVKFAAFSSAAVVVLALVASVMIVRDINDLYDEVMTEMGEFKEYANGAWDVGRRVLAADEFNCCRACSFSPRLKFVRPDTLTTDKVIPAEAEEACSKNIYSF